MTPERRKEASNISAVFHASLVELGFDVTAESLEEWQKYTTSGVQLASSLGRFVDIMLSIIGVRRIEARRLATAYTRLHRALHTGYTFNTGGLTASIESLREDFYRAVERTTPGILQSDGSVVNGNGEVLAGPRLSTDYEDVIVEEIELPQEGPLDDRAQAEYTAQVINSAGKAVRNYNITVRDTPAQVKQKQDVARRNGGALSAGAAQRATLNAPREQIDGIAKKDSRVIGYVRVSGTGTPCGWCAMLISRGVVYKSEATGGRRDALERNTPRGERTAAEKYHPNCYCYAEPVYSQEQFDEDPRFNLNRELDIEWGRETKGLRGKAAIAAFRKYIREKYADRPGGGRLT